MEIDSRKRYHIQAMIRIDLPIELEARLQQEFGDVNQAAKEALLLQAFREGKLTHYELCLGLGLDRYATNALLKQRGIFEGSMTQEDIEADLATLDRVLGPARR